MTKKLYSLFTIISLVIALGFGSALADVRTTELMCGQYEDGGDVLVWNDADNLYVKFVVPEGSDCLVETHVHVATSLEGIPQKNGNPPPGKFDYSNTHECVMEWMYTIPLEWGAGTQLYIAAHASTGVSDMMWVYSGAGNETFTAYNGLGTTEYTCPQVAGPRTGTSVSAWNHPAWESNVNPNFKYGEWIWEAEYPVNLICGDVVDFTRSFTIPGYPYAGRLWVTANNGYEATLNNNFLGSDGLFGDWRNSDLTESFVTTDMGSWSTVEEYDLAGYLLQGSNQFIFETANEYMYTDDGSDPVGSIENNPGGLIYEAQISYYLDGETCWGAGEAFPGKNWATYFEYTVLEDILPPPG